MALALALALAGCGDGSPAGWTVRGGFLRDDQGRAVILRGANVSGRHKSAPYLDFHGPDDFQRMRRDWGMNAVRLVMPWAAVEPEPGRYDDAYLDAIAERLSWAAAADLRVVLDMHQDLYGEGFGGDGAPRWTCDEARYQAFVPRTPWFLGYLDANVAACFDGLWADPSRLVAAWEHVAARLADQPAVVGFDIVNEPHWGSADIRGFEPASLQPVYQRAIAAVQARARWIPFVEPSAARNLGAGFPTRLARFPVPVVYAPHAYDADAESGGGFDPTHAADLAGNIAALADEARGLDAALVLGEYGGVAKAGGIGAYMDAVHDAAATAAAGTFYWHYGRDEGYGLLDSAGNEKPELLAALVRPYPERVAGDPVSWSYEGGRLTLVYHPARGTTVIVLPPRLFPSGARVICDGCQSELTPGEARITAPPRGDPATIAVEPAPSP